MTLQAGSSSKYGPRTGKTEFEILKESHKFLRDEDEAPESLTWDEQLAAKYYSSLFREFAVCDLKHYKSGNFALRWRTEDEVLSGAGETTCGNTRCKHYNVPDHLNSHVQPSLTTLELPFAYVEHGESRSALVKVVLCPRCLDKLMYRRRKEKANAPDPVRHEEDGQGVGDPVERRTRDPKEGSKERQEERHVRNDTSLRDTESRVEDRKLSHRREVWRSREDRLRDRSRKRSARSRSPRRTDNGAK